MFCYSTGIVIKTETIDYIQTEITELKCTSLIKMFISEKNCRRYSESVASDLFKYSSQCLSGMQIKV